MTDTITILNRATGNGGDIFPGEFPIKINNLSTNPMKNKDMKLKRYAEFYLVNQNDDFIFPGMAIWGEHSKFLVITKFSEIKDLHGVPINVEERKKQNNIPKGWDLYFFKAMTFAPNELLNLTNSNEKMRKVMEDRMNDQIKATKEQYEFEINELNKRAEAWRQMYEKQQDQLDNFTNEQFQKTVDRSKRLVQTISNIASGEIEYSLEETSKIEDRDLERAEDDE